MYSFIISLVVLVVGYLLYGTFIERVFGADPARKTPAFTMRDDIDYIPMPTWKVFLIQFLNIAGLGPIFGAIMGIQFGPAAFLWIAIGTIFGGAVHDYMSGMMSVRSGGMSLPEINGEHLGKVLKSVMRAFSLALMILVGAVFVINPASILEGMIPGFVSIDIWVLIIFVYYMLATLLPVDKLIGNLYPVFGVSLLFMAIGILVSLLGRLEFVPEFTSGLHNRYAVTEGNEIFPMMFVSIACGAISGFHATQSPMMARCITNERHGRYIFYGSMVAEGFVALIWAAAAIAFFKGDFTALSDYLAETKGAAPLVNAISVDWLGTVGGFLAVLGVVAAPITTGDTALRSARLIASDWLKIKQNSIVKRLLVAVPIFALAFLVMKVDYTILWRYFGWCNQVLAVFTLWVITIYLVKRNKPYIITLIPALFMSMVCLTYIFNSKAGLALNYTISLVISAVITVAILAMFVYKMKDFRAMGVNEK